jgi:hypothetical protein
MDNTHNHKPDPKSITASQEEIDLVLKVVEDKYDTVLPNGEAAKLVSLIKEFRQRQYESSKGTTARRFVDEAAADLKVIIQQIPDLDSDEGTSQEDASVPIEIEPFREMQRLVNEMRGLIVESRHASPEKQVMEKLARLLKEHYGIESDEAQLEQAIQVLSMKLWYEEGLDKSLDKCLDDLLVITDKRKRGESFSGVDLHDKVAQAIEATARSIKIKPSA